MFNTADSELLNQKPYSIIYSRLYRGKDLSTSVQSLCYTTGMSDRSLRRHIEIMRNSGICIISCVNGYYLPENEEDLERYIKRMEKTARSYFYILRSAKRELRRMKERSQMKIEG